MLLFNTLLLSIGLWFLISSSGTIMVASAAETPFTIIAGTYSDHIEVLKFDPSSKSLSSLAKSPFPLNHPSWVAAHPTKSNIILATSETDTDGHLLTLSFDSQSNSLSTISQVSSGGGAPAHASFTKDGKFILVANYMTGTGAAYSVDENGKLTGPTGDATFAFEGTGPVADRQEGSHPHEARIHPGLENTFYVPDLGADVVQRVDIDNNGKINLAEKTSVKAGSGPRHFAVHPSTKRAYLLCELANALDIFTLSPEGTLKEEQAGLTVLPPSVDPASTGPKQFGAAEIDVSPDGRFVYASNRNLTEPITGSDTIAIFEVSPDDGRLISDKPQHVETGGRQPRGFILFADGQYLIVGNPAGQNPSTVIFKRDSQSGQLEQVAKLDLPQGQGHTAFAVVS